MVAAKWKWVSAEDEFEVPALSEVTNGWKEVKPDLDTDVPAECEVFVREVVQNFKDAADDWPTGKRLGTPRLSFEFLTVEGAQASQLRSDLNLDSLAETFEAIGPEATSQMRIRHDSQAFQQSSSPLTLLVVREENTSGMFGPWHRSGRAELDNGLKLKRKMAKAFLSHSRSYATSNKGLGSFGEGKKAILNISGPKCVLAYTAFDPALTDDGAWSRFAGFTFWQDFEVDGKLFSGLAMIGDDTQGHLRPEPFKNQDAYSIIQRLGIPGVALREQNDPKDWGTTLIFVDPSIKPVECAEALVRNWWPLIDSGEAEFQVLDGEDEVQLPELPELEPFRDLAKGAKAATVSDWLEADGPAVEIHEMSVSTCTTAAGRITLSVDMRPSLGFSLQNEEENRSFIALIREGMIIHYEPINEGRSKDRPPFVRGIFEVNRSEYPESEDLLRKSEPPLHNEWRGNFRNSEQAARHAKAVLSSIKSYVSDFKEQYRKSSPTMDLELELFNQTFSLRSKAGPVDDPEPRIRKTLFTVNSEKLELKETQDHNRQASSKQSVKLSKLGALRADENGDRHLDVRVKIGWEVLEEGVFVSAFDGQALLKEVPTEFEEVAPMEYVGKLTERLQVFEWDSPEYSEPWSIKPAITVELVEDLEGDDHAE